MTDGDVCNDRGDIYDQERGVVAVGAVLVTTEQAIRAMRHGWHALDAICDARFILLERGVYEMSYGAD